MSTFAQAYCLTAPKVFSGIHLRTSSQEMFMNSIHNMRSEKTLLKLLSRDLQVSGLSTETFNTHYSDDIMGEMASQITSIPIVYLSVYSGADQRKHQSPASLAFMRRIHRWPVNSPYKGPVTRKMFPFDDAIMPVAKMQSGCGYSFHSFIL